MKNVLKRAISVLLVAVMVFGSSPLAGGLPELNLFSAKAEAAEAEEIITIPENELSWSTDENGNVTITTYYGSYYGNGTVKIPSTVEGKPVTAIAGYAFGWNLCCDTLLLPESVKTVSEYAFVATEIKTISLGNGVETVGECAFADIWEPFSIYAGRNLKSVGTDAFGYDGCYCETIYYQGTREEWDAIEFANNKEIYDERVVCLGKPVGKSNIDSYAELDSEYDSFVYIGTEVYEVSSGELTDYKVRAGDWLEFRTYIKSDFYVGASSIHSLFDNSFFDVSAVADNTAVNSGNSSLSDNVLINAGSDAASNVNNIKNYSGLDEAVINSNNDVWVSTTFNTAGTRLALKFTDDGWFYSYRVQVREDLEDGAKASVSSPSELWQSHPGVLTEKNRRPSNVRVSTVFVSDSAPMYSACKTMAVSTYNGTLTNVIIDDMNHEFTVSNGEEGEKFYVFNYDSEGYLHSHTEYAEGETINIENSSDDYAGTVDLKTGKLIDGTKMPACNINAREVSTSERFDLRIHLDGGTFDSSALPEDITDNGDGTLTVKIPFNSELNADYLSGIFGNISPVKEGSAFSGIFETADGITSEDSFTLTDINGVDFHAKYYLPEYTATFYYEKGATEPVETFPAYSGAVINTRASTYTAPEGKKFAGWADCDTDEIVSTTPKLNYSYSTDKSFYAVWEDCDSSVTVMVRDYKNGSGWKFGGIRYGDSGSRILRNDMIAFIEEIAEAEGINIAYYGSTQFPYLTRDEAGTGFVNVGPGVVLNGHTTYYLLSTFDFNVTWKVSVFDEETGDVTGEYTETTSVVSTVSNGETGVYSANALYNGDLTPPEIFVFIGWIDEATGEEVACDEVSGITLNTNSGSDRTFVANYVSSGKNSVKWIVDGEKVSSAYYLAGDSIAVPENPEKAGFTFAGWGAEVPSTVPDEDLVFTAQWEINRYTVTWIIDGSETVAEYSYGDKILMPENPEKVGFTFAGWGAEVPSTMPDEDLVFTAQWETNRYTVTWIVDGSETVDEYSYGDEIFMPENPVKEGYIFGGWTPEPEKIMPDYNLYYTATWIQIETDNSCGDNLTWTFNESTGELIISGTGDMWDWTSSSDAPWYNHCSSIKTVTLPDGLTSIGDYSFAYCESIASVEIPDGVTRIGYGAFRYCINLTSITLPDGLTSIGDYAFVDCASLKSITIPDGVTSIGKCAFGYCINLTSVTIPDSVTNIGDYSFTYCESLASIEIPDSVTSIGKGAFENCTNLTDAVLGDGLTSISFRAFNECINLTSVTIGDSVTSIGEEAFYSCYNLGSVIIPDSVTSIGDSAFYQCMAMEYIHIPSSVTTIGNNNILPDDEQSEFVEWFKTKLENATEEELEDYAKQGITKESFANWQPTTLICSDSENSAAKTFAEENGNQFKVCGGDHREEYTVTFIVDGVQSVISVKEGDAIPFENPVKEGYTFVGWTPAIPETMPAYDLVFTAVFASEKYKVTWIVDGNETVVEYNCGDEISVPENPVKEGYVFGGWSPAVPATMPDYDLWFTAIWYEHTISGVCGDNLTWTLNTETGEFVISGTGDMNICNDSYGYRLWNSYCQAIKSVIISDGATSIGDEAFSDCTNLASVTIPDSMTSIGGYAFYGCESLESVTIPESVTSIGTAAFRDCESLESVTIHESVTSIGDYAFSSCASLVSITADKNNPNYSSDEYGVLFNKDKTVLIQYPAGNTRTSYIIPDSVITIGDYAFCDSTNLESVTIPDSVTSIGGYAFYGCASLVNVEIPDSVTTIGRSAFRECTALTGIIIPDSVTSVGEDAFRKCINLTDAVIGNGITRIERYAFCECHALKNITLPDSLSSIDYGAFCGCVNLEHISIPDGVTVIGESSFTVCTNLESVIIPESVTSIGYAAFYMCLSMEYIHIPSSVTTLCSGAVFEDSLKAKKIEEFKTLPEEGQAIYGFTKEELENLKPATLICSDSENSAAKTFAEENGNQFEVCDGHGGGEIPEEPEILSGICGENLTWTFDESTSKLTISGTGEIPSSLYHSIPWDIYSSIKTVEISDGVTGIGYRAFVSCSGLTNIIIPDSVTSIGQEAFYDCSELVNITIDPDNESYSNDEYGVLFNRDKTVLVYYPEGHRRTSYTIPDGVVSIGYRSFLNNSYLMTLEIPDTVVHIEQGAFSESSIYENSDNWEDSVLYIDDCLIKAEESITGEYTVRDGTRYIGEGAFVGCFNLKNVILPDSLKVIDGSAFAVCYSLEDIILPDGVTNVGEYAFINCMSMEYIHIPSSVTSIGESVVPSDSDKASFLEYLKNISDDELAEIGLTKEKVEKLKPTTLICSDSEDSCAEIYAELNGNEFKVCDGDHREEYTVTFNIDGVQSVISVKEGEAIPFENPEKEGHTFVEWSPAIPDVMPAENIEFTAVFEVNSYSVRWIIDGMIISETHKFGDAMDQSKSFEKAGYTFIGWTPAIPETMPAYDLEFTAIFEINLSDAVFNANGGAFPDGDLVKRISTEHNTEIVAPQNPERAGYQFAGWAYNGKNIGTDVGIMDSADGKIFDAVWIPNEKTTYKVETYTMNTRGEYEVSYILVNAFVSEEVSVNPSASEGFEINEEKSVLSGTVTSEEMLVLKVYIDRIQYAFTTVVLDKETTVMYYYGSVVAEPSRPSADGYLFRYWEPRVPVIMPAHDVTVTAKLEEYRTPRIVMLAPEKRTIYYGESITLRVQTYDLPSYAKIKWEVLGDGVSIKPSASGKTCKVTSTSNGNVVVRAYIVSSSGNTITSDGLNPIYDSQYLYSEVTFWQVIVNFIKRLFGKTDALSQFFTDIM